VGHFTEPPKRLIVAMTGASGSIVGVRLLQKLRGTGIETHLVMSRDATNGTYGPWLRDWRGSWRKARRRSADDGKRPHTEHLASI
jgi:3-polyprenyl-4-hydroxybenzoate decarboxylase